MWSSKGSLKYGHLRQVVAKYRCKWYEMHCEGKFKLRSHKTSYCLKEVVTKAGLTVLNLHFKK
jgi:hypothetical protein